MNINHAATIAVDKHLKKYQELMDQIHFNEFLLINIVKKKHKRKLFLNRIIDLQELAEIEYINAHAADNSKRKSA